MSHLLQIHDLEVKFALRTGDITAIDGINLTLDRGEKLGIVGESGAGKSVTGFSIIITTFQNVHFHRQQIHLDVNFDR